MSVLQTLQSQWDVIRGRYHAFQLSSSGPDRDEASKVLQQVRGEELHRVVDDDPWTSPAFDGRRVPTTDFAVRDRKAGAIVGVLQYVAVRDLLAIPATVDAYALERLSPEMQAKSMAATFFALSPEARKTAAGFVLLVEAFRTVSEMKTSGAVFIAEPPLLARYASLGARPLAPMRASAYGGYRVPMIFLLADHAHLERVHSPLRFAVKADAFAADDVGLQWLKTFEAQHGRIATGVRGYDVAEDGAVHEVLTRGMSPAEVESVLKGCLTLRSAQGDRILARGDGGVVVGVVATGAVNVVVGEKIVAVLGPGEPFGEMAFATHQPRTADLVAATPETTLLQLSPGALQHLPPSASATLWKNIAWCLARRLEATTAQL